MPSPNAHAARTALLSLAALSAIACSKPKTDDLERLDSGASIDVVEDRAASMDAHADASADGMDASAMRDVNQCEVGLGSRFDLCSGACVEIASDRNNCGMCGRRCAPDQACSEGSCVFACSAGLVACDNRCVDPRTNPDYCGAQGDCLGALNRGSQCVGGRSCVAGRCQFVCPAGQIACDGNCVDPAANPAYCGARNECTGADRGTVCPSGQVCTAMGCRCPAGFVSCGGTCIDPNTNRDNCGASLDCAGANAGTRCPMGQICVGGTCGTTCGTGAVLCGGNCIEPLSNRTFCGARGDCTGANAGSTCSASELCINGTCTYYEPPQSYACLGIEDPFDASFDTIRPIDVSIGSVRNGTIYFTCNGTRPVMGAAGTTSAANVVVIPVGTSACRTLRWFEDYGAPVGAERIVHSLTVNAPAVPPAINTRGSYVDAVRINSRGPVALLRPGEMFTLEYNHQWWHSNPGAYCPGCVVQSSVSMDFDNADGFISLECASYFGGLYYPGTRATRRVTLTAPTRPGRYAIRTTISDQFSCRNGTGAYPGGRAVGFIFVR
ncbi:MAG: hypothetical protein U0269_04590 [Polyangiales bacterium]